MFDVLLDIAALVLSVGGLFLVASFIAAVSR